MLRGVRAGWYFSVCPHGHREAQWEWGLPGVNTSSSTYRLDGIKYITPPLNFSFFICKKTHLVEFFWGVNPVKYRVFNKYNQLFTGNMRTRLGFCPDSHPPFISHSLHVGHCTGHITTLCPLIFPSAPALSPLGVLCCSYSAFCAWLAISWAGSTWHDTSVHTLWALGWSCLSDANPHLWFSSSFMKDVCETFLLLTFICKLQCFGTSRSCIWVQMDSEMASHSNICYSQSHSWCQSDKSPTPPAGVVCSLPAALLPSSHSSAFDQRARAFYRRPCSARYGYPGQRLLYPIHWDEGVSHLPAAP